MIFDLSYLSGDTLEVIYEDLEEHYIDLKDELRSGRERLLTPRDKFLVEEIARMKGMLTEIYEEQIRRGERIHDENDPDTPPIRRVRQMSDEDLNSGTFW